MPEVRWADEPAEHDYPAAASYLELLAAPDLAATVAELMRQAPTVHHPVKDILRSARLPLLPADDPEVAKDLKKIKKKIPLSPILLLRGDLGSGRILQVADGYHRVCASYHVGENTPIPCRIAELPSS